jgi:hypothetical protein
MTHIGHDGWLRLWTHTRTGPLEGPFSGRRAPYPPNRLLNTTIPAVIFAAIILSFIPHDIAYGPQAALIAECFPARLRYSGSSLGFHLASIIAGGPAPLIATALLAWTGSGYSVALYVLLSCVISIAATIPLPDYTNRDISEEPVYGPAESAVLAKASPGD